MSVHALEDNVAPGPTAEASNSGTSLVVQKLRLCPSSARGVGSTPGWGTEIPRAVCHGQKMKINKTFFKRNTEKTLNSINQENFCRVIITR